MLDKLKNKKMRGEGHIIAVMLVIAAVVVVCLIFKTEITKWLSTIMASFSSNTVSIFNNM